MAGSSEDLEPRVRGATGKFGCGPGPSGRQRSHEHAPESLPGARRRAWIRWCVGWR